MKLKAEYITHGNNDLTVVNAARVSFDKMTDVIGDGDAKLIKYLASHNHWTPFAHCRFTFIGTDGILKSVPHETELRQGLVFSPALTKVRHSFFGWVHLLRNGYVNPIYVRNIIDRLVFEMPVSSNAYGIINMCPYYKTDSDVYVPTDEKDPRFIDHTLRETVPIFVARQRFKHTVDIDYNEVSRRYVSDEPDFFTPDAWRGAPTNGAKQGSSDDLPENLQFWSNAKLKYVHSVCLEAYNELLSNGASPEQARMVLPQSMMTSYYVTGSQVSWERSFDLRIDGHAQKEIRDLAVQWGDLIEGLKQ